MAGGLYVSFSDPLRPNKPAAFFNIFRKDLLLCVELFQLDWKKNRRDELVKKCSKPLLLFRTMVPCQVAVLGFPLLKLSMKIRIKFHVKNL